jgi:signal transduction histidine kinase
LTALQGFSELLATRAFAPSEVRRLAEIMRGEIERLGRIVSDFLDLARLERGLAPAIRRVVLDPAPLIAAAVELFRRTRTTHRLELHVEGALPHVDADADALDRVLKNLIGNALKYSPPGSCVRVRARAADGPGIPAEERARVFEPYYRVRETAALGPGTGLGLSVVRSLVEAHGGTVRADTAPGVGTRMTVILPALP